LKRRVFAVSGIVALVTMACLTTALPASPAPSVSARSFGALGNGTHDDTVALQRAMRAASNRGGGIVYLPAGTYKVRAMTIPSNVTLTGDGASRSWLRGPITAGSRVTLTRLKVGTAGRAFSLTPGAHDSAFSDCLFTGGLPDSGGVLTLTNPCYNLTFRNCIIDSGPMNGVTIVDVGGTIYDITFEGCTFRPSKGMGFECLGRPRGLPGGYHNINVLNCTFEPQGYEAISFDDAGFGAAGDCTISGNLIKGAGTNWSSAAPWGQGIEVNGPKNMTVTHNTIYQCKRELLNLQWHGTGDCGWVISDNVLDNSVLAGSPATMEGVNVIGAINVYGGVFARNVVTSAAPGGGAAFSGCHNMDWRTTTWHDARGPAYETPWQGGGSSGNLL
jgi:hypothetical protein